MLVQRLARRTAAKPFSRSFTEAAPAWHSGPLMKKLGFSAADIEAFDATPKRWSLTSRGKLWLDVELNGQWMRAEATRQDVPPRYLEELDSKLAHRTRVPGDIAPGGENFLDPAKPVPRPSLKRSERLKTFVPGPAFFPWRNEQVIYMKVNAGHPTWHFIQEKWYFDRLCSWINDKVARWAWDPGMKWFDKGLFEWLGPAGMRYVGREGSNWIARRVHSLNIGFLMANVALTIAVMAVHAWAVVYWLPEDASVLEHFKQWRGKNVVFASGSGSLSDFRMSDSA